MFLRPHWDQAIPESDCSHWQSDYRRPPGRDSVETLVNGLGTWQRHVVVGHIDFAESRQNGFQQLVFVLDHDEKPRVVAKQFDTPTQGGLGVDGQFVGIIEDDAFEQIVVITLDIGF